MTLLYSSTTVRECITGRRSPGQVRIMGCKQKKWSASKPEIGRRDRVGLAIVFYYLYSSWSCFWGLTDEGTLPLPELGSIQRRQRTHLWTSLSCTNQPVPHQLPMQFSRSKPLSAYPSHLKAILGGQEQALCFRAHRQYPKQPVINLLTQSCLFLPAETTARPWPVLPSQVVCPLLCPAASPHGPLWEGISLLWGFVTKKLLSRW